MDELNGRLVACQLLAAGLVARLANASPDPLRFVTEFRDEMHAVAAGIRIGGAENDAEVRDVARRTLDELFALMKPPSDGAIS
ncbi:MAG: hypothetical protein KDJ40_03585 [Hyphomicrobiales bacterium]|nr:hypothetical protein [Methylobacteriaceae bacterium]MCC2106708.1 hypothetical protein [Hyphomicrobiales bacterium]HPG02359.1 hypothetical protein [Rhodoblastus sp.]